MWSNREAGSSELASAIRCLWGQIGKAVQTKEISYGFDLGAHFHSQWVRYSGASSGLDGGRGFSVDCMGSNGFAEVLSNAREQVSGIFTSNSVLPASRFLKSRRGEQRLVHLSANDRRTASRFLKSRRGERASMSGGNSFLSRLTLPEIATWGTGLYFCWPAVVACPASRFLKSRRGERP